MKTQRLTSLPGIHEWGEYINKSKVAFFRGIPMASFLVNCEFGKGLDCRTTDEFCEYGKRCKEFVDRLIVVLLENGSATSVVARRLYCFCPVLLLESDDNGVFDLFVEMCDVLVSCGLLSQDESKAAVEEHSSLVIEKRREHDGLERAASEIANVVRFSLDDYSFQSRRHAFWVFNQCGLIVGVTRRGYPSVTFDLSDCSLGGSISTLCSSCTDFRVECWKLS